MRKAIALLTLLLLITGSAPASTIDAVITGAQGVKAEITALEQRIAAAEAQAQTLAATNATLTSERAALTAQVAALQTEIATARARIVELEAKLPPPSTALGAAAAALQPGQWGKLPITDDMRLALNNESGNSGTLHTYAENLVWDPASRQLLFVGSDHGKPAKFVTYRATSNSWHIEPTVPWMQAWTGTVDHGYRQAGDVGAFYRRTGAGPSNPTGRIVNRFDTATQTWTTLPPIPSTVNNYLTVAPGMVYFPERRSLVMTSTGSPYQVFEYDTVGKAWRGLGKATLGSYHHSTEYNPVHKVVLIAAGVQQPRVMYKLDAAGVVTRLKDAPDDLELGVYRAIIVADPVTGDFLVASRGRMFSYDITTETWRLLPFAPPPSMSTASAIVGLVAAPVPDYGVTVWAACTKLKGPCQLHAYKHVKGAGVPHIPPPPVVVLPAPSAATLPTSPQTFAERCAQPGVVRCQAFDAPVPLDVATGAANTIQGAIDTQIKASGAGALRFTIPSNTGPNSSGSYQTNFADDLSVQFGEGEEFYVQWRQRFSPEMMLNMSGGGWKTIIIGEGDRPGKEAYSCTQLEVVMNNGGWKRGFPVMYHSCGQKDGGYEGLYGRTASGDYLVQNAVADCGTTFTGTAPPCVGFQVERWMTFQVRVRVGNWYRNDSRYFKNSAVELWIAHEGERSRKVISLLNYDLANTTAAKYGKVWLLTYNTGKDPAFAHAPAVTWYDELIISRQPIADPT